MAMLFEQPEVRCPKCGCVIPANSLQDARSLIACENCAKQVAVPYKTNRSARLPRGATPEGQEALITPETPKIAV